MASNPNDGTVLGTSEVIADEYIDPNTVARREPNLPATGYKVPRSKIAVGAYGQDAGDASMAVPLNVESTHERMIAEMQALRDRELATASLARSCAWERQTTADFRGHAFSTRGVR